MSPKAGLLIRRHQKSSNLRSMSFPLRSAMLPDPGFPGEIVFCYGFHCDITGCNITGCNITDCNILKSSIKKADQQIHCNKSTGFATISKKKCIILSTFKNSRCIYYQYCYNLENSWHQKMNQEDRVTYLQTCNELFSDYRRPACVQTGDTVQDLYFLGSFQPAAVLKYVSLKRWWSTYYENFGK